MKVFVVYAHPCQESFTYSAKEEFLRGLREAGHTYEVSDLYGDSFSGEFTKEEYLREAFYDGSMPVPEEVIREQQKINAADVIAFFYPVFWTEAPAKLVGWFQRVWTYGFAYGPNQTMKQLKKAMFFVSMGGSMHDEVRRQQVEAMKVVMLGDRIHDRAAEKQMFVFDEMTHGYGNENNREDRMKRYLQQIHQRGIDLA